VPEEPERGPEERKNWDELHLDLCRSGVVVTIGLDSHPEARAPAEKRFGGVLHDGRRRGR